MVRCVDCGFLATKTDSGFTETRLEFRERPWDGGANYYLSHADFPNPYCFLLKDDLRSWNDTPLDGTSERLTRDRDCDGFVQWRQGFGPRETREMAWEDERRARMDKLAAEDREWRDKQARQDREFHDRMERLNRAHFNWNLLIVGVLATAAICTSQIVGALIAAGKIG